MFRSIQITNRLNSQKHNHPLLVLLLSSRRPNHDFDFDKREKPQRKRPRKSFSSSGYTPRKGRKGPKPSPEDERILKKIRAKRIEDAIELIGKFHKEDKAVKLQLDTFHSVLRACSSSRRRDAGLMANNAIEWMQKYQKDRRLDRQPSVFTYTMAINAWSKSNHPDSGKQAEEILQKISILTKDKPDVVSYSAVITAWAKQGNAPRAERIFERMIHDFKSGNLKAKPNVYTYNALMDAWARSNSEEAGEKCDSLLLQMEAKYERGELDQKPDTISYNTAINAWSKQGNAAKAEAVYHRMIDQGVKPNVRTFSSVMDAWARSKSKEKGEKCELLLDQMETNYQKTGVLDQKPNAISYNTVINAWSKQGNAVKAEAVYERMIDQGVKPNVRTFNSLMDAWARSKSEQAGDKCESFLDRIEAKYATGELDQKPDTISYNTAINAWAKQGNAAKTEAVYQRMIDQGVKPNVRTFNSLMDAWARSKSKEKGEKCELLLDQMEAKYKTRDLSQKPDTISYTSAINAWAKQGNALKAEAVYERMIDQGVKPNVPTFNSLMDAWARSESKEAGGKCGLWLDQMESKYETGELDEKPNTISYNTAINAWAKQGNAVNAEAVYKRMVDQGVKPNVRTFNSLMDAWARSKSEEAGEKCELLLDQMGDMYESGELEERPNTISYTSAINAWAKQGNLRRAEEVFDQMVQDYNENGNKSAKPDVFSFSSLVDSCAKSGSPEAGPKGDGILHRMLKQWNTEPNEISLTSLLECWQESNDSPQRTKRVTEIQMAIAKLRKIQCL